MIKMKVKIYTTQWCHFCHAAKSYLDEKGVKYEEIDIENDGRASADIIERAGQDTVPIIEADGKIIIGFDKKKIDGVLKL